MPPADYLVIYRFHDSKGYATIEDYYRAYGPLLFFFFIVDEEALGRKLDVVQCLNVVLFAPGWGGAGMVIQGRKNLFWLCTSLKRMVI